MFRGIYGSIAAMLVQERAVDVASNNLANAETSGFSKSLAVAKAFPEGNLCRSERGIGGNVSEETVGTAGLGVVLSETAVNTEPGTVRNTGNPLDCAISGEGYFQVSDGQNTFYSRAGNFSLDSEGNLVTPSGLTLMGEGGSITPGEASSVEIASDGTVVADGDEIGRIAVFRFRSPSNLLRRGGSLLSVTEASGPAEQVEAEEVAILSGALEGSNVNIVEEMTRMIEASRAYEAASKAFESGSESARKMIETFGS